MHLRAGSPDDLLFLEEMLFEAFHWRADAPRPRLESVRGTPEFEKLLAGWGRPGDLAVIALDEAGSRIGAAWCRRWTRETHSYGFVDEQTPELGIAVRGERRASGVGSALLAALLEAARASGARAISLSVDPANPARRLYERHGFRKVGEAGTSWTLLADLRRAPPASAPAPPGILTPPEQGGSR
jgi:ribosomal protein S18 acetylase RimI-like enzyme